MGGLGGLPTPLVVLSSGGDAQFPAFVPDTLFLFQALQKWRLGFSVSLYLLSRICPNCMCNTVVFSPTVSLYFDAGGEVWPGTNVHVCSAVSDYFQPHSL